MASKPLTRYQVLRAYWRAFWRLCPLCCSDAPALYLCTCCRGFRGRASRLQSAAWLYSYFLGSE
jgi:hypothetical protein